MSPGFRPWALATYAGTTSPREFPHFLTVASTLELYVGLYISLPSGCPRVPIRHDGEIRFVRQRRRSGDLRPLRSFVLFSRSRSTSRIPFSRVPSHARLAASPKVRYARSASWAFASAPDSRAFVTPAI